MSWAIQVGLYRPSTRWDVRENLPSKAMEDAIVKTVAAFLKTDAGRSSSASARMGGLSAWVMTTSG